MPTLANDPGLLTNADSGSKTLVCLQAWRLTWRQTISAHLGRCTASPCGLRMRPPCSFGSGPPVALDRPGRTPRALAILPSHRHAAQGLHRKKRCPENRTRQKPQRIQSSAWPCWLTACLLTGGHQTIQMTLRYTHLATHDLDQCATVLNAVNRAAAGNASGAKASQEQPDP